MLYSLDKQVPLDSSQHLNHQNTLCVQVTLANWRSSCICGAKKAMASSLVEAKAIPEGSRGGFLGDKISSLRQSCPSYSVSYVSEKASNPQTCGKLSVIRGSCEKKYKRNVRFLELSQSRFESTLKSGTNNGTKYLSFTAQ